MTSSQHRQQASTTTLATLDQPQDLQDPQDPQESHSRPVTAPTSPRNNPQHAYQKLCVADPVALQFLEKDEAIEVVERAHILQGYTTYIVEQWSCSRNATGQITAYTGDAQNVIQVGILSVPEESHSLRLRAYFETLAQQHARRRETTAGLLHVTNLSGFPSSLAIIPVPQGNVDKYRAEFHVQENLKRLGVLGRIALNLSEPCKPSTQAKFYQLYKVSEKIAFNSAVTELVRLLQVALMLFGLLELDAMDGFLCDHTGKAVNNFWAEIGMDLYNVDNPPGVGPITFAAVLGTLISARNRLGAAGCPLKDAFDPQPMMRAITQFQKAQRISRTRRLDRQTLHKLHQVTAKQVAKQASGEGWVKSAIGDLSGKGGEMILESLGRGDKTALAEAETISIETLVQNVKGPSAKWLFLGKPTKTKSHHFEAPRNLVFHKPGGHTRGPSRDQDVDVPQSADTSTNKMSIDLPRPTDDNDVSQKGVFRRATGRIKGAVGAGEKGHRSKPSVPAPVSERRDYNNSTDSLYQTSAHSSRRHAAKPSFANVMTETPIDSSTDFRDFDTGRHGALDPHMSSNALTTITSATNTDPGTTTDTTYTDDTDASRAESRVRAPEIKPSSLVRRDPTILLRRTRSFSALLPLLQNPSRSARTLSFSAVESYILATPIDPILPFVAGSSSAPRETAHEAVLANHHRTLFASLLTVSTGPLPWTQSQLASLASLTTSTATDVSALHRGLRPKTEDVAAIHDQAAATLEAQRAYYDGLRQLEALRSRLAYEADNLAAKVEDVDGAFAELRRKVEYAEIRVEELVRDGVLRRESHGWGRWFASIFSAGALQGPKADKVHAKQH